MNPTRNEQHALEIYNMLVSGFENDEDKVWDLDKIDATEWFTGLVKAGALIFNRLTEDDKNYIEWTHIQQKLLIQDMMEKGRGENG